MQNPIRKFIRPESDALILIVDDEPVNSLVMQAMLSELYSTEVVSSGEQALEFCEQNEPDLIILDYIMPGISGLETCRLLKANSALKNIPVIFVTSLTSDKDQNQCWDVGCVDFVSKPVNGVTLRNRVHSHIQLKLQNDALWKMSYLDGLTGIYNRRMLDDTFPKLQRNAKRTGSSFSLLMIDVDWFKVFNDTYGHLIGDDCLIRVCNAMESSINRPFDILLRYGGEEFLCLLPDTDTDGAKRVAALLLSSVRDLAIPHSGSKFGIVTVSIGICSAEAGGAQSQTDCLKIADDCLYQAKNAGRNRAEATP